MSCPDCDGHIEFPAEGVGQFVSCPHCGKEVELNDSKFEELLAKANKGNALAQFELAKLYEVQKNYSEAQGWYTHAALKHIPGAAKARDRCFELDKLHGSTISQVELLKAIKRRNSRAAAAAAPSQFQRGAHYEEMHIWSESIKWYGKAAKNGFPGATEACNRVHEIKALKEVEASEALKRAKDALIEKRDRDSRLDFWKTMLALVLATMLFAVAFAGVLVLMGWVGVVVVDWFENLPRQTSSQSGHDHMAYDAYYTAKKFIERDYVRAKKVSSYDDSEIKDLGNGVWTVEAVVDGVNAFNAPVRNLMLVKLKSQDGQWLLLSIYEH